MNDEIKNFIEENINLIQQNQWETIYERYRTTLGLSTLADFTQVLFDCGIDPLLYLKIIPRYYFDNGSIEYLIIPKNVEKISMKSFYRCKNLKTLTILGDDLKVIEEQAFQMCEQLEQVNLSDSIEAIAGGAFINCKSLTSFRFPESLKFLGQQVFYECSSLKIVYVNNQLTYLSHGLFEYCFNLKDIYLPKSITDIGKNIFTNCRQIVIHYDGTKTDFRRIKKHNSWKNNCNGITVKCLDGSISYI